MEVVKVQIRSAQNVGKVWISRKKSSWAHLGPFFAWAVMYLPIFFPKIQNNCLFIHLGPGWGVMYFSSTPLYFLLMLPKTDMCMEDTDQPSRAQARPKPWAQARAQAWAQARAQARAQAN